MSNDIRVAAGVPTGGQFAAHSRGDAEVQLRPETPARFVRQAWGFNDHLVDLEDSDDFDATPFLDAAPLDDVISGDLDWVAYEAISAGVVEEHNGPFDVDIDPAVLEAYAEAREDAGQFDPITGPVEWTERRSTEAVAAAARRAAETLEAALPAIDFTADVPRPISSDEIDAMTGAAKKSLSELELIPSAQLAGYALISAEKLKRQLSDLAAVDPRRFQRDGYTLRVALTAAGIRRAAAGS